MTALLCVTGSACIHLFMLSTERAKEIRRELFQRDLRDLVGRFDADERFVLANNLDELLQERRALQPLLLPRQYYTGLPTAASLPPPRQPPRNCFVQLEPTLGSTSGGDRICAYFTENAAFGRYLYLSASIADDELVPLKPGDIKLAADALRLEISFAGKVITWWLTYQVPPSFVRPDRYELTAFRQIDANQRDRDRKLEGWAYYQRGPQGGKINLIARLDFKEFLDNADDELWPPLEWRTTTLAVERKDAKSGSPSVAQIAFKRSGVSELSLSKLGGQIFGAYGGIQIESNRDGQRRVRSVEPPAEMQPRLAPGPLGFRLYGGDLLLPSESSSHPEPLSDTDLVLTVSHPWRPIEKVFFQMAMYLAVLLIGGAFATWYFRKNLLEPISDWSKYSEQLAKVGTGSSVELPYAKRRDEIGVLATAINSLIQKVRDQMVEAQDERENRLAEDRRKQQTELDNRLQNLQVIGHEIRSPLQALIALHRDPADKSHRYVARMLAALPHLLGGEATMDAISARKIKSYEFDFASFLHEVANNAGSADIHNVQYAGEQGGVLCVGDPEMLEDAVTNVLNNANRHRDRGTPIVLRLVETDSMVGVEICNLGAQIPPATAEKMFEFGFSTVVRQGEEGQGFGLFVSQDYVRRMEGVISFRNLDQGVAFTIMLPRNPKVSA